MRDFLDNLKNIYSDAKNALSNTTNMLYFLIAVNAVVYLLNFNVALTSRSTNYLAIIGAIFSHGSFGHMFFNMLGLYIFGRLLCKHIKSWHLLGLYLFCGILGNLIFILSFQMQDFAILGASGAVFGIIFATAMVEPDQKFVIIFLPFYPLKTKTLAIVYLIIEVISQRSGASTDIAHLAHLGGILGGYIFAEIFLRKYIAWEPLSFIFGKKKPSMQWKTYPEAKTTKPKVKNVKVNPSDSDKISQSELDYLLDKVSSGGINALSKEELARLRKAREQIMGQSQN